MHQYEQSGSLSGVKLVVSMWHLISSLKIILFCLTPFFASDYDNQLKFRLLSPKAWVTLSSGGNSHYETHFDYQDICVLLQSRRPGIRQQWNTDSFKVVQVTLEIPQSADSGRGRKCNHGIYLMWKGKKGSTPYFLFLNMFQMCYNGFG